MVDKHRVNILYTAPTAIRALMAEGDKAIEGTDRSSLRILGSVGEPINPEAGVVLEEDRQRKMPGNGHTVADRNRWVHDHPNAGCDPLKSRFSDPTVLRRPACAGG